MGKSAVRPTLILIGLPFTHLGRSTTVSVDLYPKPIATAAEVAVETCMYISHRLALPASLQHFRLVTATGQKKAKDVTPS